MDINNKNGILINQSKFSSLIKFSLLIKNISACLNKKIIVLITSIFISPNLHAIEDDKKLHLGTGTGIGFVSQSILDDEFNSFLFCSSVGGAKELYDELDYGGADHKDFLFTMLGCAVGVMSNEAVGLKVVKTDDGGMFKIKIKF